MAKVPDPIVVWSGRQYESNGYATGARAHIHVLRDAGWPVVAVDLETRKVLGSHPDRTVEISRSPDRLTIRAIDPRQPIVSVVHERPDMYPRVITSGRSRAVGFSYWETPDLPQDWAGWMTSMDAIWTSSEFNREVFQKGGVPSWMIDVVGHPVDSLVHEIAPTATDLRKRWSESTVFLSVVSSVIGRRDLNLLFEAFSSAFSAEDNVALVLKCPRGGGETVGDALARVMLAQPGRSSGSWPSVYIIDDHLSREQLMRLQASVDAYVSCERANGWDLPLMDSMALGIPGVNVDFGGSTEFCTGDDSFSVPVSSRMVRADDTLTAKHWLYSGQYWPYVDPNQLADQLKLVHADPIERTRRGQLAAERVGTEYSGPSVAKVVGDLMVDLDDVDFRGNGPATVSIFESSRWNRTEEGSVPRRNTAVLAGLLADPAFAVPSQPKAFLAAYKRASSFAGAKHDMGRSPLRKAMSAAMATRKTSPVELALRLRKLHAVAKDTGHKHGSVEELRLLAETMLDYDDCVRTGGTTRFEPEAAADRRRQAWNKFGPLKTPTADLIRLKSLRDVHKGERIFILGNGPSLTKCDLTPLANEYTFGVNKIYMLFDQISWRPTYYTLLDWRMGDAVAPALRDVQGMTRFYPERYRGILPETAETYWYWNRAVAHHTRDQFERDMTRGIPSRATVIVTAIQQAFYLGFREIYLIGVDASYTIPDTVQQSGPDQFATGTQLHLQSTADDDPNHFDPRYFGVGDRWHDPNPLEMRRTLRNVRKGVERHGGRLTNATVGGSLEELPRVDYRELF